MGRCVVCVWRGVGGRPVLVVAWCVEAVPPLLLLCILATPVYVDCLPALVLAALDRLGAAEVWERRPVLLPIVQCGFPELSHTVLALEVLAAAAEGVATGGGGGYAVAIVDSAAADDGLVTAVWEAADAGITAVLPVVGIAAAAVAPGSAEAASILKPIFF